MCLLHSSRHTIFDPERKLTDERKDTGGTEILWLYGPPCVCPTASRLRLTRVLDAPVARSSARASQLATDGHRKNDAISTTGVLRGCS